MPAGHFGCISSSPSWTLNSILDRLDGFLALLGPDGVIIQSGSSSLAKLVADRGDVRGIPIWESPWWQSNPGVVAWLRDAMIHAANGIDIHAEHELAVSAGPVDRLWIEIQLKPIRDESGRIVSILVETHDRTEKRRIETELVQRTRDLQKLYDRLQVFARANYPPAFGGNSAKAPSLLDLMIETLVEGEEFFRALADAVPILIWATPPDGDADYFNHRWYSYSGLTPKASLGAGWVNAVHPEDRERVLDQWLKARASERSYQCELRIRQADGVYRWHLTRGAPFHNEQGRIIRWIGTATDIDDSMNAQEALSHYIGRLENLRTIDRAIVAARSPEEVARFALESLADCVSFECASVMMLDFSERRARFLASVGPNLDKSTIPPIVPLGVIGIEDLEHLERCEVFQVDDLDRSARVSTPLESTLPRIHPVVRPASAHR